MACGRALIPNIFVNDPVNKVPIVFVWQGVIVGPLSEIVGNSLFSR